jgi:hypothetical protein
MRAGIILRWAARVWGIASTLLILAFAFGGLEHLRLTPGEAVGFLCFPVGVVAGFVVAWWREGLGGVIAIGSLALFYLWMFARDGRVPGGPYFLLFAAPGFLHVASALIRRQRGQSAHNADPVSRPGRPENHAP